MTKHKTTQCDFGALAARIRDGDPSGLDALLGELWREVVVYVRRFLGTTDDAQDIAQEAFVRVWESRSRIDPTRSLRAFVYQIAHNLALNEMKRRETQARLAIEREPPAVRGPAEDLDRADLAARIRAAIEALPTRRRQAFMLAHLHGLTYREVADVMEISAQSVANQISAALADLRRDLGPQLRLAARTASQDGGRRGAAAAEG